MNFGMERYPWLKIEFRAPQKLLAERSETLSSIFDLAASLIENTHFARVVLLESERKKFTKESRKVRISDYLPETDVNGEKVSQIRIRIFEDTFTFEENKRFANSYASHVKHELVLIRSKETGSINISFIDHSYNAGTHRHHWREWDQKNIAKDMAELEEIKAALSLAIEKI